MNKELKAYYKSIEDLPVLAYRLQNILNDIYSNKIKSKIPDYEKNYS